MSGLSLSHITDAAAEAIYVPFLTSSMPIPPMFDEIDKVIAELIDTDSELKSKVEEAVDDAFIASGWISA